MIGSIAQKSIMVIGFFQKPYLHGLDIEHQQQLHVQEHVGVVALFQAFRQHAE